MSNVFDKLIEKAKGTGKRIVLTESEDERVIKAAGMAAEMNLCTVVLLGNKAELEPKYTAEMLKNTGDAILVKACPVCYKCGFGIGSGENRIGKTLMQIRSELQK